MARTKVSSVAQPDDFRETLEHWGVPLTSSVSSLRRYLPLMLAKFCEVMCDELEAHLPEHEKSAKIHFITASAAQLSRTAAAASVSEGKAAETPAAAPVPEPAPTPVSAPPKRAYRKKEKPKSHPVPSKPAPTPYLAERSSRRQPVPSTSKLPSPAKKKVEKEEEEVEDEDEGEAGNKLEEDKDDEPDERTGGESSGGGSGAEPDDKQDGAEDNPDNEDMNDYSPDDSGSSHSPSGDLRQLSLDAPPPPSRFTISGPSSLPQPLTSTNLLALSHPTSLHTVSATVPRKPFFRAPTPIPPPNDSDDSDADDILPVPRRTYPSPPSSSDLSSLSDSPEPESEPIETHRRSTRHPSASPRNSRFRLPSPTPSASSSASSSYSVITRLPKKITSPATSFTRIKPDSVAKQRRSTFEVFIPLKRYRFDVAEEESCEPVRKKLKLVGAFAAASEMHGGAMMEGSAVCADA